MSGERLSPLFLPHLPAGAEGRIASSDRLEQSLADVLELSRATFPDIPLPPETFLAFLARRIPEGKSVEVGLLELKVADLYLACACLERIPRAVARFEAEYLVEIKQALSRMETAAVQVEDVKQMICQKLLTADGEAPPRLARYSGSGDLRSWLCVVAVRAALDQLRREKDAPPIADSAMADAVAPEEDQELQYLKQLYRVEFKAAFEEALATLTTRERNILRHQVLDGLTLDQIGAVYNVHRATVARWNARLRERLLKQTRRALLARLHTTGSELESIMRLIQSHLDVSIRRHLSRRDEEKP